MYKKLIILLLLSFSLLFSLTEFATGDSQSYICQLSPGINCILVKNNGIYTVYDDSFAQIARFSLPVNATYILGFGADFDEDDNYEVMYSVQANSVNSLYVYDITNQSLELNLSGNYHYFGFTNYVGTTRIVNAYRMNSSTYEYDWCKVYKGRTNLVSTSNSVNANIPSFNLNNYPNPFNSSSRINFELKKANNVCLEVYNIKGQKVKTIFNGTKNTGKHSFNWNGLNENNQKVANGMYFYKLSTQQGMEIKKAILIK